MWSNLSTHMGMSGLGKVPAIPAADKYEPGAFLSMISPAGDYTPDPSGTEIYLRCPEGTDRRRGPERTGDKFEYFCYTPAERQAFREQEDSAWRKELRQRKMQRQMYLISLGAAAVGILVYAPGYWKATAAIPGGIIALAFGIRGLG